MFFNIIKTLVLKKDDLNLEIEIRKLDLLEAHSVQIRGVKEQVFILNSFNGILTHGFLFANGCCHKSITYREEQREKIS